MIKTDPHTSNALIKQLPQSLVFTNQKYEIIHVSDKWISDFSIDGSQNMIGENLVDLFSNFSRSWQKVLNECINGEPGEWRRNCYLAEDRTEKWFELLKSPWHDDNENVIGWILQAEKVSQYAYNEVQLDKLHMLSAQMSDIAKIGLWEYDLEKDKMIWSEMTKIIHEVGPDYEPNIEESTAFYKTGYSRNTMAMNIEKAIKNETGFSEKLQLVTSKGKEVWVIISAKPHYLMGNFTGLVGTIQNIDTLTQSEIRTKENEYQLKTLIDNLPLNVLIKDLSSKKILANKSEMDFCGVTNEAEIIGTNDDDFLEKESAKRARKDDINVLRTLKPILGKETIRIKKNGTKVVFHNSKIPLVNADGSAYGLVCINMDITDLKNKEKDLKSLIDVTKLQNEKLLNFAHIVSHNLRSHTANFSMLLEFLQNEKVETEKQNLLNMLTTASDNLLETINNLNEVVAITTKKSLKKIAVNLNEKIKIARQNFNALLLNKEITIENNINNSECIRVVPAYFESILINFFSNAIKYQSPKRSLVIKLDLKREDEFTILSFEDNGLGIDLKKHGSKLFGMYKTFHENEEARGIGLYMVKNQVEAMKGKITVESKVDVGTTFKIYFNEKD